MVSLFCSWFFPQVEVITKKTKGKWFWKKTTETRAWHYLKVKNAALAEVIEGQPNILKINEVVGFKTMSEAESWSRRYADAMEDKNKQQNEEYIKILSVLHDDSKNHPIK